MCSLTIYNETDLAQENIGTVWCSVLDDVLNQCLSNLATLKCVHFNSQIFPAFLKLPSLANSIVNETEEWTGIANHQRTHGNNLFVENQKVFLTKFILWRKTLKRFDLNPWLAFTLCLCSLGLGQYHFRSFYPVANQNNLLHHTKIFNFISIWILNL